MPSTQTDRIDGLSTSVAVKAPCKVVSTTALTLSGEQTIGGVACVDGDRVLYALAGGSVSNGIWVVSAGAWSRAKDFDGARDVVKGTLVLVAPGTADSEIYVITTSGTISPGTTTITIEAFSGDSATLIADLANSSTLTKGDFLIGTKRDLTNSVASTVHDWIEEQPVNVVSDFGADPTGVASSKTAFQNAFAISKTIYIPAGTYDMGSLADGVAAIDLTARGDGFNIICGPGVLLKCTTTGATGIPYFFSLNNNNDFTCGDIAFEDTAGDPTVTWKGAFGFYVQNSTGQSWGNIKISSINATNLVAPIAVQGPQEAANRVRGIHIGQMNLTDCYYGLSLQDEGDGVVVDQIIADACVRPVFVYGVNGVKAKVFARNNRATSAAINISRGIGGLNTRDIQIDYVSRDNSNTITHVNINHQDTAGGEIDNVRVRLNIESSVSYTPVRFITYNAGAEHAASTANVITDVSLSGWCDVQAGAVSTPSAFNTKGRLNFEYGTNLYFATSIPAQFKLGESENASAVTWGSSGTAPAIGDGTCVSSSIVTDGWYSTVITLTAGSTTTFGTGDWTFTLPYAASQSGGGAVYMRDATGNYWTGTARVAAGASTVGIYLNNSASGANATAPFTWAQSDVLEAYVSFRIAQ
jgi:hypothetical protein